MKLKTITVSTILIFLFVSVFPKNVYAQYIIIPEFSTTETYASNTLYKWTVRLSVTGVVTTVAFSFSWLANPVTNTTDPKDGRASVWVKTPPTSQGKSHTVTVSSPDKLFETRTFTINTEIGIYPRISYYNKQFYNPEGADDIVIYVEPVETDYGISVTPTTWDVTATGPIGIVKGTQPVEVSVGKYKVVFDLGNTASCIGDYTITVKLMKANYITVPVQIAVNVGTPKIIAKAASPESNSESWIVMDPSGNRNPSSGIFVVKGIEYLYVEFYDTKLNPLEPYDYDFILHTPTGDVSYKQYTLYVEKVSANKFKIWFVFTETYDLTVVAKRGNIYDVFQETIKINTEKRGFNIWDWILNPYIMFVFLFIILLIVISVSKKRSKIEK